MWGEFYLPRHSILNSFLSSSPLSISFNLIMATPSCKLFFSNRRTQIKSVSPPSNFATPQTNANAQFPTMSDIINSSKAQNVDLQLTTVGPFFRITAKSLITHNYLGKAEGFVRVWFNGKILHLDSIRLQKETLGMEKSIFGIGLFLGAVAVRHGYDCGCKTAELLAINDSDLYHSKLVRFYRRIGFEVVYEVKGGSMGDLAHMLVWGGIGTRMDAKVEDLLLRWCTRFMPPT